MSRARRVALCTLVLVALSGSLFAVPGVQAASPNYTLTGYVYEPLGHFPVPSGVVVDLQSRASGTVYTTATKANGQFTFTTAGTSGALAPGYWGVWVPPVGNVSLTGCKPCAVLPSNPNPIYGYENTTALTTTNYPTVVKSVGILPYNSTISGVVKFGTSPVAGASVRLLAPTYSGLVLANNTTASNGSYSLKIPSSIDAPTGAWVLQSTMPGPTPNYSNETSVVLTGTATVNPVIRPYLVAGTIQTPYGSPVPTAGNATLFDLTNGYIYTDPTSPGGYYQLGTYPGNFVSGSESFEVVLAADGYSTGSYALTVSPPPSLMTRDFPLPVVGPSQLGLFATTLNFSGINVLSGTGSLAVTTNATLGNDTYFGELPNGTVGQLWGQLGLDFAHSLSFPSTDLPAFYSWVNSTGPFFPAVQAATAINGTAFLGPTSPQKLASASSTCSGTCGLTSNDSISLRWAQSYTLNGTLFKNSSSYTFSFGFRHPTNGEVFNYTVVLPAGYVLQAGTAAPANTALAPAGPEGTWTSFTLNSQPGPEPGGTFQFNAVRYSALSAIVNVSVTNFAFSSHNVLNSTRGNYTVVVGLGQNVTFSALNSLYPANNNGTKFAWVFGDGGTATTTTASTYHYYTTATGSTPYPGSLTVTSSGGLVDSTAFYVWVGVGPVTAGLAWNATASENRAIAGTTYVFVNWSTILHFNATMSSAVIGPGAPIPGNISVASYSLTAWKGFSTTIANYSVAQGSSSLAFSNVSYQFLGAGAYLSSGRVNGSSVPFKGWQYNLTLTVWSSTGQSAQQTLVILVNDTEKPVAAFLLLNAAGKQISNSGVVAGSNASAQVLFDGANASDPHNGSIFRYYWLVTNSAISSLHRGVNMSTVRPYPSIWLNASTTAYTINLTVWDLNGNSGYATQSLTVSVNTTITPTMLARNFTGPSKLADGTSYTFWVNVTTGGGTKSVAQNVQVTFYYTTSGGTSRTFIAGTPGSVMFYNYSSPGVPNSAPQAVGTLPKLAYNVTVRALVTWTPSVSGSFDLYANISATNQFTGTTYPNVAVLSISISPNPTTQLLEYAAIAIAVVVVIALIVVYYRRRSRRAASPRSSGRAGLERGSRKGEDEDDEDSS